MCVKSHRHFCLQSILIVLLVLCLLLFLSSAIFDLAVYLLTSSATVLQGDVLHASASDQVETTVLLTDDSSSAGNQSTLDLPQPSPLVDNRSNDPPSLADQIVDGLFKSNCSMITWMEQSGRLLQLCPPTAAHNSGHQFDKRFAQCLRESFLFKGLSTLLPVLLVTLSLVAVCRLLLCPLITLAIIYLLLAIGLVAAVILYQSGVIIDQGWPLFVLVLTVVALYALFSMLHILLFALVRCEQRHLQSNGDNEKIVKRSADEDDELDDPNAPLYKNGMNANKKNDFEEKIKEFKYIDDDTSYILRRG